jgi:hypothetical protein
VELLQSYSPDRRTHLLKTTREHLNIIDAFHQLGSYRAAALWGGKSRSASSGSLIGIRWSRHSRRAVPTQRSAIEFARGARIGVRRLSASPANPAGQRHRAW